MHTRHILNPNSTIDPIVHQRTIKNAYDNDEHYTQNLDYFMELVKELEDDAEDFDFEQEMHYSLYNSDTFEYLVSSNPYVIKQVPTHLLTTRMIDEIVNNYPNSFDLLCSCEIDIDQETCEKILDQMEGFSDFYDADTYENIIELFLDLFSGVYCV